LEGGAYVVQSPDENGCLHSVVFPGLVLDAEALLDDDPAAVLTRLNEALGSETHRNFVSQLEEARSDA
jgi:hypothetical protein